MPKLSTPLRNLSDVIDEEPLIEEFVKRANGLERALDDALTLETVKGSDLQGQIPESEHHWPVTLVFLPDHFEAELADLANSDFDFINFDSADLYSKRSFAILKGPTTSLHIDIWRTNILGKANPETHGFYLGFIAGKKWALARQNNDPMECEEIANSLQAQITNSGPNYKNNIWTDEEMAEAAGKSERYDPLVAKTDTVLCITGR